MQPDKITPLNLFSKPARYLCPIFQRGYVWTLEDQIKPLWRDVLYQVQKVQEAAAIGAMRKHFLGAIVLKTDTKGVRYVPRSEVIDGQQRITTLQVLFIAIRDAIEPLKDLLLNKRLDNLTSNGTEFADPDEVFKVWPTSAFQEEFKAIATAGSPLEVRRRFPPHKINRRRYTRPGLVQAYLFLSAAVGQFLRGEDYQEPLEEGDSDALDDLIASLGRPDPAVQAQGAPPPIDPKRAELLLDVVQNHLQLIEIRLESQDDAQIIFETLNARGAPLKAGDLVRNFLFLQAARRRENPEALYRAHWKDFDDTVDPTVVGRGKRKDVETRFWRMEERQGRLTSVRLDLLLFHYLTLRRQSEFKFGHLYQCFREWWETGSERDIRKELELLAAAGKTFRALIERDQKTRFGLFAHRLRALDTTTVYPLVLLLSEHEEAMGRRGV